jgi:hypothetical protein
MRLLLSAAVIGGICLASAPTFVQGHGRLSLFSDAAFTECTLSDTAPGVVNVYMAETSLEATGLRFRIAASSGFTGVWLGETSPFSKIGSSPTDISIGFASCQVGRFLVLTVTYQLFVTSTCSQLSIVAASGFSEPICTGCLFQELPCWGYDPVHINCSGSFDCNPVAVEPSTWGRVKSLYRD